MPAWRADMPSAGPISPTRICGANRLVTMTPVAVAASQTKERVSPERSVMEVVSEAVIGTLAKEKRQAFMHRLQYATIEM